MNILAIYGKNKVIRFFGGVCMINKKTLPLKSQDQQNPFDSFDYEKYCEMVNDGLTDADIANDLHVNQKFLNKLKDEAKEDY